MKRVINKASHATVTDTVARLIAEVEARGMKLFTTFDHSSEASWGSTPSRTRPSVGKPDATPQSNPGSQSGQA